MVGQKRNRMAAVLACASLVALAACAGDTAQTEDTAGTTVGAATGDVAPAPATPPATAPGVTTADAMTITGGEPELIQVLATVDQSEVEAGRLAADRAQNAQVKRFARTLVNEHSRSMRRAGEIGKALGVSLTTGTGRAGDTASAATRTDTAARAGAAMASASAVVSHLQSMHSQMMDQLRSASGAGFDSAFVNGQVQAHQQVLDMLQRSQAQMQVQNSQLQQHATQATQSIQKHLEQAQQLQQRLSGAATGTDTGSAARSDTAGKARRDTSRRS